MNDTDPEIALKFREMMLKKSPEERLKMGCSMFSFSKAIVKSSILQETGNVQPSELKKKLFLRFYAKEMDEKSKEKIVKYFTNLK